MKKIVDLTHLLQASVAVCPGHPRFVQRPVATLGKDPYNVQTLIMGSHTGTHIDAPFHFFEDGRKVDDLDLNALLASAVLVDVRGKRAREKITWEDDLSKHAHRLRPGVIVLICTGWSKYWGEPAYTDHPHLELEAAQKLMELGIRVIGSDTLSPDEFPVGEDSVACFDVHRVILGAGGVIAENLNNLEAVLELGDDLMVNLLPLKLNGCDGSPIRAVAWSGDSKPLSHIIYHMIARLI